MLYCRIIAEAIMEKQYEYVHELLEKIIYQNYNTLVKFRCTLRVPNKSLLVLHFGDENILIFFL